MEKRKMKPSAFWRKYIRLIIGGSVIVGIILVAIFAPYIATHDPREGNIYDMNQFPSEEHLCGTDLYGRDIFSRIIYGTRSSLIISFVVVTLRSGIGIPLGLIIGYYRRADKIVMRILESISALPTLVLCLALITIMGDGVDKLIFAMVATSVPSSARFVRSMVLSLKEKEFVECAKASGASDFRIMFKYILPQCTSTLILSYCNSLGSTILTQAGLAFLGVGLDPQMPNWGSIINEGRDLVMVQPHQCGFAGLAIMITVLAFSVFGDGLRDILDPKLR